MEEFGMQITVGDPFAAFTYTNHIKGSHSIEVVYFAMFTDPLTNIQLHTDDHSEYRWVSLDEIEAITTISAEEKLNIIKGLQLLHGETIVTG